jgi:hypothetical protein
VTSAAHRIDVLLAADPESVGEERPPTRRILFESPLVVLYRVDAANDRVIVSQVREYYTRAPFAHFFSAGGSG